MQPGANLYTQGFGSRPENVEVPHIDTRAPAASDVNYPLGKNWLDKSSGSYYVLSNFSSTNGTLTANWGFLGSSSGDLNTLTTDDLTVVTPTAGTILFHGTANQIVTTGGNSPGQVTSALSSTLVAPGSVRATTTLTATLGAITATNGNLVLSGAGNKLVIHTTTTASDSVGTSGVMGGTPGAVTITTSACTTTSTILYSRATTGGTPGQVSITSQLNGSFVLTSTGNETSTFNYLIIN